MNRTPIKDFLFLSFLAILCMAVNASTKPNPEEAKDFTIANTIQSHMVLQQSRPAVIWGKAETGDEINVKGDWMKKPLKGYGDKDGNWKVSIPVPDAKAGDYTAHTLQVIHSGDTVLFTDILVGEVWICSGQSNMDMTIKPFLPWMKGALNYEKEIAEADYPAIRLFDVRTDFKALPEEDCGGQWKVCSPLTAGDFSAAAYFFGRDIYQKLQVPVGLVVSSVGGSSCQAWTSRKALNSDALLNKKYLFPYDTSARSEEPLDTVVTFEKVVRPTLFYNAMIYPLRNLSIRGFVWYQGESNKDDGAIYTRLCAAMIHNWRSLFHQDDLPFYYVQVAPYNWQQNDTTAYSYALLREAQDAIRDTVKNTGMAVIMDISEPDDIHPRDKQGVGSRLAQLALANTYSIKNIICRGPEFNGFTVDGQTLKVSFKPLTIGRGLTTNDAASPRHFFLAGADRIFYPAKARIVNDEVWLYSEKVSRPVAVRYAFTNYPVTNFCNKDGLPAPPFRSDHW